jgi:tRNA (guanine-N7-)-methyltransferase
MTASQHGWFERYSPLWVIDVASGDLATSVGPQDLLDFDQIFGRRASLIVEIGSGHGETLAAACVESPDKNFVGFEVFEASIASTLGKIASTGTSNVRLIAADAISGLTHLVPDHSIDEIWVFFPDPWQKKKHHKRRLVSPSFADLVWHKLTPTGVLRLATDWESYAVAMEATFAQDTRFTLASRQRFGTRPLTKFESRGVAAGRTIYDFEYHKVGS